MTFIFSSLSSPANLHCGDPPIIQTAGIFCLHVASIRLLKASRRTGRMAPLPPAAASSAEDRRSPEPASEPGTRMARFAELAGETAAECAAIFCCFPCGLVNLVVVVAVKIPVGLVRRALRRRRNRRRKKAGISWTRARVFEEDDFSIPRGALLAAGRHREPWPARRPSEEVLELEKIMRASFHGAGFWRSPSQREKSMVEHKN